MKCYFTDNALALNPNGDIVPCCWFKTDSANKNKLENINHIDSLNQISNSLIFKETRDSLNKNSWISGCTTCQVEELKTGVSRRTRYLERETTWMKDKRFLDFSIGNICNLKCIMCKSNFSSQWFKESKILYDNGFEEYRSNTPSSDLLNSNNINKLIDYIESDQKEVIIEIKGGEPFAFPKIKDFFEKISECKTKVHIAIVTNGTFFPSWFPDLTEKIDFEISVSIDGVDEIFDYVRGNGKYNYKLVDSNIKEFNKLPLKGFYLHHVIQNTNIHGLERFDNRYKNVKKLYDVIRRPYWLQPHIMPDNSKNIIVENLNRNDNFKKSIDALQQNNDDNEYNRFIRFAAILDKERKKSLPDIAPHLFTEKSLEQYKQILEQI